MNAELVFDKIKNKRTNRIRLPLQMRCQVVLFFI